jgi:hypothetical protein
MIANIIENSYAREVGRSLRLPFIRHADGQLQSRRVNS